MARREVMAQPPANRVLAELPPDEMGSIRGRLEPVWMSSGDVIYESGDRLSHIYFPTTSVVSLVYVTLTGATAETGLTGSDGVVGLALFLGGGTTIGRAVVESSGEAIRLQSRAALDLFRTCGEFHRLVLLYTQALMTQMSQTAICNRLHNTEQRFCRWLLTNYDFLGNRRLSMTHEGIANLLGVRREAVSLAAEVLQRQQAIHYVRGAITLLDRAKLETLSCECYRVVSDEYARLFRTVPGRAGR